MGDSLWAFNLLLFFLRVAFFAGLVSGELQLVLSLSVEWGAQGGDIQKSADISIPKTTIIIKYDIFSPLKRKNKKIAGGNNRGLYFYIFYGLLLGVFFW
jgi:hypothetical protein